MSEARSAPVALDSVIVIAGPTASGKSSLALELVDWLRAADRCAEILCADSITLYRGFEIGAAKPSAADRARVPHHLLDLADPAQEFTAGDFVRAASEKIEELQRAGTVPVLVGGAGFYLRALLWGMASPEENSAKAAEVKLVLEARAASEGYEALHRELLRKDPGSAGVVHGNDHYRIIRALQAMELHGKPWSELNQAARQQPSHYPGLRYFALQVDRGELEERIRARAQAMLADGLLEEVRGLLAQGVPAEAKPMRSVGYLECADVLAGRASAAGLLEAIVHSTKKLAKQQQTWFRGERDVEWLAPPYRTSLKKALSLP